MVKKVIKFFDKLEDKTRGFLSHYPIFYGFLGGVGIVLFWRGVWHTADVVSVALLVDEEISTFAIIDGPLSIFIGSIILLVTGVFVSEFIGNKIIISGLVGGKKLSEMQKEEIETEEAQLENIENTLIRMEKKISEIETKIEETN